MLDFAHELACRIADGAEWSDGACTWTVMSPDMTRGARRVIPTAAGPTLYQGTAGIGLLLAEAYVRTGDAAVGRAAHGAIRHATATAAMLSAQAYGFHSGRAGVAFALARAATALDNPAYTVAARSILSPVLRSSLASASGDVIGGAAGAIPAFLLLARMLDWPELRSAACSMGLSLVRKARRGSHGWGWWSASAGHVQPLLGLSHGASGYGAAFTELFAETHEPMFRHAAEQAFAYERHAYDRESESWPDYRHRFLSAYVNFRSGIEELRTMLRGGFSVPAHEPKVMAAWCHGAAGIALAQLRAWTVLGDDVYRSEAERAVQATEMSVETEGWNYSACHGYAGNCDALLEGARILGWPHLAGTVEKRLWAGYARYVTGRKPWPCGTVGAVEDPSLLIGTAGVAYLALRIADASLPSVLRLVCDTEAQADAGSGAADRPNARLSECRRADAKEFFSTTLDALERFAPAAAAAVETSVAQLERIPVVADICEIVAVIIGRMVSGKARDMLTDVFVLERARCDMLAQTADLTTEWVEDLRRSAFRDRMHCSLPLRLAPGVRVLSTRWKWHGWASSGSAEPTEEHTQYILYIRDGMSRIQEIGPWAAWVFNSLRTSRTIGELEELRGTIGPSAPDERHWAEFLRRQLDEALGAGIIAVTPRQGESALASELH